MCGWFDSLVMLIFTPLIHTFDCVNDGVNSGNVAWAPTFESHHMSGYNTNRHPESYRSSSHLHPGSFSLEPLGMRHNAAHFSFPMNGRKPARSHHLRVFVFNSTLSCRGYVDGKFRWQQAVRWLVPDAMRAPSPEDADLLYHPACLVDAYFHERVLNSGAWRSAVRDVEDQVMHDVARYWPQKPLVINALRCTSSDVASATVGLRTLWRWPPVEEHSGIRRGQLRRSWKQASELDHRNPGSAWVGRVCGEAFSLAGPARPHQPCSLYMPYLTEPADSPEVVRRPPAQRDIDLLFIGSEMPKRAYFLRALRRMSVTHRVHILSLLPAMLGRQSRAISAELHATARSLMSRARFTLCPPGDTPESERIYQALQHGSIPLVNDRFSGPPFINWSLVSLPLSVTVGMGVNAWRIELPTAQRTDELHANIADMVVNRGDLHWDAQRLSDYVGTQLSRIAEQCFGIRRTSYPVPPATHAQ